MEFYRVNNTDTGEQTIISVDDYNRLNALPNFNLEILETGLIDGMTPAEKADYDAKLAAETANRPPLL